MLTSPNIQPWVPSEGKYFKDSPQMDAIYTYLNSLTTRRNVDKPAALVILTDMIQHLDHNVRDICTLSFMWSCLLLENLWILRYFLQAGLNPNVQIAHSSSSSLIKDAACTNTQALEILLRAGGHPTVHPGDDLPLLHYAVGSTYIRRIQLLVQHGADINAQDSQGDTPLHIVSNDLPSKGHMRMLHHLLTYTPNIHIRNNAGCTVLHTVHSPQMARVFLDNGADIHAQDYEGRTPLHYVVLRVDQRKRLWPNAHECFTDKVNTGLLKLFLEYGAKVTVPDHTNQTVFDYAQQYSERWVSLIREKMREETTQQ
jgi:ankyrin repeat protein